MRPLLAFYRTLPSALRALLLMVGHTAAVATLHVAVRQASAEGLHPYQTSFFRSFIALAWMTPWLLRQGPSALRTARPGLHVTRGLFNVGAMVTLHVAIAVPTPLSLIAAVAFTAPLFASIGAVTLLREPLLASRAGAVLVGFAGALIVLRPGTSGFSLGALWVVVHAACWAGALLTTKRMARTEAPAVTVAYTMLMLTLCTLPLALSAWTWPTAAALGWMALVGLLQVTNQLALAQAMREADATVVMPFDFLRLVWASIYGYLVYAEQPHLATWAGGSVIFAAATVLTLAETRGRAPARPPLGSRS